MATPNYGHEFQDKALAMAERDGVKATCEKLGLTPRKIYDWRKLKKGRAKRTKGFADSQLLSGETAEQAVKRLTKERDEALEANYILKKALGFFVER